MVFFAGVDSVKPVYLLWALLFLKCYNTNTRNAAITGVDEKTFRHWSWIFVEAIANLDREVVSFTIVDYKLNHCRPLFTYFLFFRSAGIIGWLEMMVQSLAWFIMMARTSVPISCFDCHSGRDASGMITNPMVLVSSMRLLLLAFKLVTLCTMLDPFALPSMISLSIGPSSKTCYVLERR